ncbi:MAG: hypothetical protein K2X44_08135 [Magnetospirillum sp.]|nr:hypothetical protein [Magnetospirillum sp.]
MQIASAGAAPSVAASRMPERAERGPDKDNDGDEANAVAATQALPTPPPGRGAKVDMVA